MPAFSVELRRVSLMRAGRPVLRKIDLRVASGERWVLVGPNGAGKTQLLKLLAGLVWPTPTPGSRRRYTLRGETFDEPAGVHDEIAYVGAERHDRYDRYQWNFTAEAVVGTGIYRTDIPLDPLTASDRRRIRALLGKFAIASLAKRRLLTLSYGERRLVLLARALAWRPQLLLLDEVANGLDRERHRALSCWLESAHAARLPWVLATHHADDIPNSMTHLLQLRAGGIARSGRLTARALRRALQSKASAAAAAHLPRAARTTAALAPPQKATRDGRTAPLVVLHHASVYQDSARVLVDIDWQIHASECWVVSGPNGSGKTTLLRTLYGDHGVATSGRIERRGVAPGVPLEAFRRWVGLIAPHLQSDHPRELTALEVVASGRHSSIGLNSRMTSVERAAARAALAVFDLEFAAARPLAELSYGQVRRVLFARAWVRRPRLLLLDEPFAGIDPETRAQLLERVEAFVREGGACVLATHHRPEWPRNATHELVLRAGRAVRCGPMEH
jgi:molybdate transport system ATP-binding protein